jgi:myo-inositol-1(or 4)-monophosphatase
MLVIFSHPVKWHFSQRRLPESILMNTLDSCTPTFLSRVDSSQGTLNNTNSDDQALLPAVVAAVQAAGKRIKDRFSPDARPHDLHDIGSMIHANDDVSLEIMRNALAKARPAIQWAQDEGGGGHLPPGECWVTDPVEGAINQIHGLTEWCVTITLVRDNVPVLTAVYLPLTDQTYTALRGGGATCDGMRLQTSLKTALNAALVGTGQAVPGESVDTYRRLGQSVTAMLSAALVVRVSVPATWQLIHIAAGRLDVFWQYSNVRCGLLAGALLVAEAGGKITDVDGQPWNLNSRHFLASAPALHEAAVKALSSVA